MTVIEMLSMTLRIHRKCYGADSERKENEIANSTRAGQVPSTLHHLLHIIIIVVVVVVVVVIIIIIIINHRIAITF